MNALPLILRAFAGICWFLALVFAFAANTEFSVTLKNGLFERTVQSYLPVKTNVRGLAHVLVNRVYIGEGPELKAIFEGMIADRRVQAPYSLELAYRIELYEQGLVMVPFMPDQKLDGHDFTVAAELLPDLFNAISTKPIHVVKKTDLLGLHVSEVQVKGDRLRVVLAGYAVPELGLVILLLVLGGVAWWQAGIRRTLD